MKDISWLFSIYRGDSTTQLCMYLEYTQYYTHRYYVEPKNPMPMLTYTFPFGGR